MKTFKDYINESLLYHSGIELNEDYGEFGENHAVSLYIANKINKLYKKHIYEKEFKVYANDIDGNVFFNSLNIYYKVADDYVLSYIYKSDIEIDIYIEIPKDYKFGELRKRIAHEFQHYCEDLILIGKGLKSFEDIFDIDSEYGILYHRAKQFNDYRIPISSRNLRRALYILDKFEQHAFVASLCEEINQLKDKNKTLVKKLSPNEIWNIIKQTNEYTAFIELANIFDKYKQDKLSDNEIEILKKEWYKLTNKNEHNEETIFNSLLSKLRKAIKKLNTVLPKKIIESLDIGLMSTVYI